MGRLSNGDLSASTQARCALHMISVFTARGCYRRETSLVGMIRDDLVELAASFLDFEPDLLWKCPKAASVSPER